jgi:hypothetical protein
MPAFGSTRWDSKAFRTFCAPSASAFGDSCRSQPPPWVRAEEGSARLQRDRPVTDRVASDFLDEVVVAVEVLKDAVLLGDDQRLNASKRAEADLPLLVFELLLQKRAAEVRIQ